MVEYFDVSFIECQRQTQYKRRSYNIVKVTPNKSISQTTNFKIEIMKIEIVIIEIVLVSKPAIRTGIAAI